MEVRCMQSPTLSSIPPSGFLEKTPFLRGHAGIKLPARRLSCPVARRVQFLDFKGSASGPTKIKSKAQDATAGDVSSKDGNLVFVAGATGRVGSRTVRELLKLGFRVRAGIRSTQRAESLVQSVKNMKLEDVEGGAKPIDKLELVECDLEKQDQIGPALDNSSIVICCIGAGEKEIFDITGPYRIDYQATKNLIDAAASAKVDQLILVTSLGTNKVGFPAAILNLFWGVLIWKRKAEEALLASGLPYTIVRPGGMERPTDSFKETHNLTLSEEDTLFGGLVSNLQVAELMAFMAKNRSLSYCKIVEVVAETSAPLTPMGELLKKIPSQREEIYPSKELDDADVSQRVAPESTYPEKKPEQVKATAATPSSPFTVYEDLKPPSSPTPSIPTISGNDKPSSPVNETSRIMHDVEEELRARPLSPYIVYEDLKPPSSPTPSVPTVSGNDKPGNPINEKLGNVNHLDESKVRPLSPYTMYEELKPPCSPSPSPKKL